MKAIIEIALALIFSALIGARGVELMSFTIKKDALIKVSQGLGSLEAFTKKLTK